MANCQNSTTLATVEIINNHTKSCLPWLNDGKFHFWLAIKLRLPRKLFFLNLKDFEVVLQSCKINIVTIELGYPGFRLLGKSFDFLFNFQHDKVSLLENHSEFSSSLCGGM